jgi:metallo-beta-lactamase class B
MQPKTPRLTRGVAAFVCGGIIIGLTVTGPGAQSPPSAVQQRIINYPFQWPGGDATRNDPPVAPCQSPDVKKHIDQAQLLVGDLSDTLIPGLLIAPRYAGMCKPPISDFRRDVVTLLPPTRAFDQLFYTGSDGWGSWALQTSDGIILLDTLSNGEQSEKIIEPSLRQLGLDPSQIKYIIVGHTHEDHWGGAKYFQDKYGTRVLVGRGDAVLLPTPGQTSRAGAAPRVEEMADGSGLTLGDTTIRLFVTPGHTPGTLTAVFPVTDQGRPHNVLVFGGYGIPSEVDPVANRNAGIRGYRASVERLIQLGRQYSVDVAITTHPFFDGTIAKVKRAQSGLAAESPWVMGHEGFSRFMSAVREMSLAIEAMAREKPPVPPR